MHHVFRMIAMITTTFFYWLYASVILSIYQQFGTFSLVIYFQKVLIRNLSIWKRGQYFKSLIIMLWKICMYITFLSCFLVISCYFFAILMSLRKYFKLRDRPPDLREPLSEALGFTQGNSKLNSSKFMLDTSTYRACCDKNLTNVQIIGC